MYLIYNQQNKKQFKFAADYAAIPSGWDAVVVSGLIDNRGEVVATKQ